VRQRTRETNRTSRCPHTSTSTSRTQHLSRLVRPPLSHWCCCWSRFEHGVQSHCSVSGGGLTPHTYTQALAYYEFNRAPSATSSEFLLATHVVAWTSVRRVHSHFKRRLLTLHSQCTHRRVLDDLTWPPTLHSQRNHLSRLKWPEGRGDLDLLSDVITRSKVALNQHKTTTLGPLTVHVYTPNL